MEQLKELKTKRGSIKRQVKRFQTFLEKPEDKNIDELEIRLSKLHDLWNEFNTVQYKIENLCDDEDPQQDIERDLFEQLYYKLVTDTKKLINSNNTVGPPSLNGDNENNSLNMSNNININNQVRLPTINLPTFSGSYDQWHEFFDTFDSLIHKNQTISDIQKFHYLKSCLTSEAAQLIHSLEISAASYQIAWSLLRDRFENKRKMVSHHIKSLFNIPSIIKESHGALRQLFDSAIKHLRALKSMELPTDSWDVLIIHLISSKFDSITRREWEEYIPGTDLPTMDQFKKFLKERCDLLETLYTEKHENLSSHKFKGQKHESPHFRAHISTYTRNCPCCQGSHRIYQCDKFEKLTINERICELKRLKLCLNCLKANHFLNDCKSSGCKKCNLRHNTLIHIDKNSSPISGEQIHVSVESTSIETNHTSMTTTEVANHATANNSSQILLATTLITVRDAVGNHHTCRALLDNGSQSNFITYELCQKLNLPTSQTNISIAGINLIQANIKHKTNIQIQSNLNAFTRIINCLVLPSITGVLPFISFNASNLNIPENIQLADPTFNKASNVDMLLGASIFYELLCIGQIKLGENKPLLQKTLLGWIVSGPVILPQSQLHCNLSCNIHEKQNDTILSNQIAKFWEIEEQFQDATTKYSQEQQECENHFIHNTTRDISGRFIVKIPFKQELNTLGESRSTALRRFYSMERKLDKNVELKDEYIDFMREYQQLGHMTKIDETNLNSSICYYFPHHPVIRELSTTTKVRVVFDGSSKTDTGVSLNDLQLIGPTVQNDLISIIIRFRKYPIVITADITKMYRQILIEESQRNLELILWREDQTDEINCYQLNTVTYGTASAPFLATRCLFQLALENQTEFPNASQVIKQDFYVDDLLTGVFTVEEAIILHKELTSILQSGQLELRKWSSNDKTVLAAINSKSEQRTLYVYENPDAKTLGVKWNSSEDYLQYSMKEFSNTEGITKRTILSTIAQMYDPLGLLGPITIIAKKIMQQLWKMKVSWDESIQGSLCTEWLNFRSQLYLINELKIPRQILCLNPTRIELHGFCDSSEHAYGACIFIRSISDDNQITVRLICAKSRVAPLKIITLPRLELCGAVLLAQLTKKVRESIQIKFDQYYCWCDSTIVLNWIQAPSYRWKTFVANRVSEIQELTQIEQWRHINSSENAADLISRGVTPENLINSSLWWNGPSFLSKNENEWPYQGFVNEESNHEMRVATTVVHITVNEFYLFNKYSSLDKLNRIIAYMLRFMFNVCTKRKEDRRQGQLMVEELQKALLQLVKVAQHESFGIDIRDLQKKSHVNSKSSILKLNPFIDENGLIRVGGRLQNSQYEYDKKHPILLHPKHKLTKLILQNEHKKLMHCGAQTLLNSIRQQFWPLSGRSLARKIVHECIICFKTNPRGQNYIMGNLPETRVTQAPPFYNSGVDYAGPFLLRDKRSRGYKIIKSYICLFICFTTKAIHLELVSDLTAETFIAALRRFCSRRGKPLNIYSDNGTNFVKANSELKELATLLTNKQTQIESGLAKDGVQWHFIPPRSPHFGGLWEAGVKSVKQHLKRVFKDALLVYEDFFTVLVQIEAILNSRPLLPLSADPNDYNSLTPAHFLIGRELTAIPDPNLLDLNENKLSNFQKLQQLIQHFWSRWTKEYMNELQQRSKWNHGAENRQQLLKPGALALIKEDNTPPLNWKLGRITEVHPGKDDVIRVVTIKTPTSVFKRAVAKICLLPVE